jgi:hypothetical protein
MSEQFSLVDKFVVTVLEAHAQDDSFAYIATKNSVEIINENTAA